MNVDIENIAGQLQKIDLFSTIDPPDLQALVAAMQEESYQENTILFRTGEVGDAMYIVRSGRIRIYMHDLNEREITLRNYTRNGVFGELSLLDHRPRSASAAAIEPTTVLILRREDLLNLLNERPQIGLALIRSLSHLLRNTTTFFEEFRPESFTSPQEDHGREFRRGAIGLMASIIDGIDVPEEANPTSQQAQEKNENGKNGDIDSEGAV